MGVDIALVNAIDGVDTALVAASVGMGFGGVVLLSTNIAVMIVLGLECAALACGLFRVSGKFISSRLAIKAKNMMKSEF